MEVEIIKYTGEFAEDKDTAREIRVKKIMPSLIGEEKIILNFSKFARIIMKWIGR